ncbi:E3 ubiquitin-protein ligase rnf213-beta-like, partial [Seriola lalandi dorsalis]|uniref:E3 ubiquitin-protein ligase rnf213-beta-like n=1 Tax=Seriola lalandi dorsalis TaxID=1841481 RepID=UPI000C6F50E7
MFSKIPSLSLPGRHTLWRCLQSTITPILASMVEDILALGVCVEQTKLLTVTSLSECKSFVHRVEFLQPCLDRAFSQKYSTLCSPGCLQHLDSIRSLWHGMLVVASFIQHIVFEVKENNVRLKELALKHCNLHLN